MTDFNLKLVAKPQPESDYKNLISAKGIDYSHYNGKVVYINFGNPDKHIYNSYYVEEGVAYGLHFKRDSNQKDPIFSLHELPLDAIIIHYTIEDKRRVEDAKKAKKP